MFRRDSKSHPGADGRASSESSSHRNIRAVGSPRATGRANA